jgi:hypothetical protein
VPSRYGVHDLRMGGLSAEERTLPPRHRRPLSAEAVCRARTL